ncbi:hypothetical protein [Streptomyces sp. NPDC006640]|uniref:hypothetical protein n=1 Tax=unclassified Streptomyces TaxID=2593676 RepID=UPI0036B0703A
MSTTDHSIPPDIAAHVLDNYGQDGGRDGGTWTGVLIRLIATASVDNRDRLAKVFPGYVAAVIAYKYDTDGLAHLQDLAAGRCTRCKQDDGPITPAGRCEACAQPMPLDGVA